MAPLSLVLLCLGAAAASAAIHYVSPSGGNVSPYTNWSDAATVLQDAVAVAVDGDTVLATNGTYATGGALTPSYALSNRVVIAKAIAVQSVHGPAETIIAGDGMTRVAYLTNGALLTGFTLTGGTATGNGDNIYDKSGGGVLMVGGGVLSNCIVSACVAQCYGGGVMCVYNGTLLHCEVSGNTAQTYSGGGVFFNMNGTADGCQISGNTAQTYGGGMLLNIGGTVAQCTITDNTAQKNSGGGLSLWYAGLITNSVIANNTAKTDAGGVDLFRGGTVVDCLINNNKATASDSTGGGVLAMISGTLYRCTLSGNKSVYGGGAYLSSGGLLAACTVSNNTATAPDAVGGGVLLSSGGMVTNCTISANKADLGGGVYFNLGGTVTNCTISGNRARLQGGGAQLTFGGRLSASTLHDNHCDLLGGALYVFGGRVDACVISNNYAADSAGGALVRAWGSSYVNASLIAGNFSSNGAGVLVYGAKAVVRNSVIAGNTSWDCGGGAYVFDDGLLLNATLVSNTAVSYGGGLYYDFEGLPYVTNSILYYNSAPQGDNYYLSGATGAFANSCTTPAADGAGNITNAPEFVNVAAGDFRLAAASPCINAGVNCPAATGLTDYDRAPRIRFGIVDMGAFENQTAIPLWCGFTADNTSPWVSNPVVFAASVDGTGALTQLTYAWDFDGTGSNGVARVDMPLATNVYTDLGDYSVALTVSNDAGVMAQCARTNYITVVPEPVAMLLAMVLCCARRR